MQQEATAALNDGNIVHYANLEPETFEEMVRWQPDFATHVDNCKSDGSPSSSGSTTWAKEAKKEWYDWLPDGALVCTEKQRNMLAGIAGELRKKPDFNRHGSKSELTLQWEDRGVLCKARIDRYWADTGELLDLKTCANLKNLSVKQMWSLIYDFQLAFYVRGLRACGFPVNTVRILGIEKTPPYDAGYVSIVMGDLDCWSERIDDVLDEYRNLPDDPNDWPGVGDCIATRPNWAMWQDADDELVEFYA